MIYTEMLEEDKIALKNNTCAIKTKIIVPSINDSEPTMVLTEEDAIKDWDYTDERLIPDIGFIGQFVARGLSGNLNAVTLSGDNLFDYQNEPVFRKDAVSTDEEGWITMSFDNSAGTSAIFTNYYTANQDLKTDTEYAIVMEVKSVTGHGRINPISIAGNIQGQFSTNVYESFVQLHAGDIKVYTAKTRSSFENISYGIRTFGTFFAGDSGSITFRLSVLENTSVTSETFNYEPFTGGYPYTLNIQDKAIELRMGIYHLDTKKENWYSFGTFYVTKPDDNNVNDNTSYEALDKTILYNQDFNADYKSENFTKSFNEACLDGTGFTALKLAQYTCEQIGVAFGSTSFTNSDFLITSNQFVSGDSCRDVMKAISQLAYSFVYIDWDDKCYIPLIDFNASNVSDIDTIDNDEYYSLNLQKNDYGPINKVLIGLSAVNGEAVQATDMDSIAQYGTNEIDIFDNPLTYTSDLRQKAIDEASVLFGLQYTSCETETIGHPWFKGYKLICIKDMNDKPKYVLPFNMEMKYTGHIKTTFSNISETKTQERLGYNKKLFKDLKDVRIELDKQAGTITAINSNVTAINDGMGSLEETVKSVIGSTYTKTEIQEIVSGIGVDGTIVTSVKSTAGTFDKDGLTIEQTDADTKTNINANGMIIYDATGGIDDALLTVNKDGVDAKNMRVHTYLNIGKHSRIEDYTSPDYVEGTGVFWIGSD